ncbi:MAG: aminomethyl-transferring glycine dehydrogenase [Deltaproteobacteria bacterium CG11_big_fil_rev_8_21_14_0_20_47_16]|nr:MAG: aminomethyl-transferring glycine dehydrogenase [Deltaproteobacteria bacterium CG11_big_fil_rev_8_21_14_0_20_47_16]
MRYIPHTSDDIREMLADIGTARVEDLFSTIPEKLQVKEPLNLPKALSEPELMAELTRLAAKNTNATTTASFLGAGAYNHYSPTLVNTLIQRSELLTPYTPYQAEIAQGTLQIIFEFQTMVANLLGFDLANASMYDGSTAMAEAALMAMRITKRKGIVVAHTAHPEYRAVLDNIITPPGAKIQLAAFASTGLMDLDQLKSQVNNTTAAVIVQSPNFFGGIESISKIADIAHAVGALCIVVVTDPTSLGLLKSPGAQGADIAVAEGQSFGLGLQFGGPNLGLFATKNEFLRMMPGRLVGETTDAEGRRGYALAFATREQHIRREKATSNICTNQALCATAATIYMATIGKQGLQQVATLSLERAVQLRKRLGKIKSISFPFSAPTYNEFVVRLPIAAADAVHKLTSKNILGGVALSRWYANQPNDLLVCTTELTQPGHIDDLGRALEEIL